MSDNKTVTSNDEIIMIKKPTASHCTSPLHAHVNKGKARVKRPIVSDNETTMSDDETSTNESIIIIVFSNCTSQSLNRMRVNIVLSNKQSDDYEPDSDPELSHQKNKKKQNKKN